MQYVDINQLNQEVQVLSCRMNDLHNILIDLRQEMSQRITHGEFYSKFNTLEQEIKSYNDQVSKLSQEVENIIEQEVEE